VEAQQPQHNNYATETAMHAGQATPAHFFPTRFGRKIVLPGESVNKKLLRVLQKGQQKNAHTHIKTYKTTSQTQQRQAAKSNATKTAAQVGAPRFFRTREKGKKKTWKGALNEL